jgi:hypothetical protein
MALASTVFFRYELDGTRLVAYVLHCIPVHSYRLELYSRMRLVSRDEFPFLLKLASGTLFRTSKPRDAVYVLYGPQRRRLYLKLTGGQHYRLRSLLGKIHQTERKCRPLQMRYGQQAYVG